MVPFSITPKGKWLVTLDYLEPVHPLLAPPVDPFGLGWKLSVGSKALARLVWARRPLSDSGILFGQQQTVCPHNVIVTHNIIAIARFPDSLPRPL